MSEFDNTIDMDDDVDGSDGGYTRHGNFIHPDAMQEILMLRGKVATLEQQLKTANGRSERLYASLQKTISITNKLLDEKAGILFFDLADTRDIESVINEYANNLEGK